MPEITTFGLGVDANIQMLLRWLHFLAGITWIGLLYFFNLVNVEFMKSLDAPTRSKVVPELMPRALWWFRWGAVVTVAAGLIYYLILLHTEPNLGRVFTVWLILVLLAWFAIYLLLKPLSGALNNGRILALLIGLVVFIMAYLILRLNGHPGASSRTLSIGIGGGIGVIMLLNVWGIIWPHQKRIIAWTRESAQKGTAMPPEAQKLARRAFLASRTNAWLSIPMLFFMGAASHYSMFGTPPGQ